MASTQVHNVTHVIDDGPSREALVDGFKYAFSDDINSAHEVWFRTNDGRVFRVSIQGLIHGGASGHNFHVFGRLLGVGLGNVRSSMGRDNFTRGFYDSHRRSGSFYVGAADIWKF